MPVLLGRLARSLPLVVALLVLALVIYVVASWRTSPNRAKVILFRSFLVVCGAVVAFFVLAALYALIDGNIVAVELALTFMLPGLVGLVITLICRAVFYRNHPSYRIKPVRATYVNQPPAWMRFLSWLLAR